MNTGAVVAHLNNGARHPGGLLSHTHRNFKGRTLRGVPHGVGEQVRHHLTHPRLITDHRCGAGRHIVGQAHQGNLTVGGGGEGIVGGVHRQVEHIERGQLRFSALINAGQRQQILHQLPHTFRLRLNTAHSGGHGVLIRQRPLPVQLGIPANTHQGGA